MINPLVTLTRGAAQLRAARAVGGVAATRQLGQLVTERFANGMSRAEYFKYRLWRPELDLVERLAYTSQRERRRSERATNWGGGRTRSSGKSNSAARLADIGLPMPELLARVGREAEHTARTPGELRALLARVGDRPLVLKPERGSQGEGILVATAADADGLTLLSGERIPADVLWRRVPGGRAMGWRVERWVEPHPLVAGWRPGTTPSVRLLTLVVSGRVIVHAASLKVPRGDSGVDNLAQGNLAAAVDLDTGAVGVATDGTGLPWFTHHPDSGVPIAGIVVPRWHEHLDLVRRGAEVFLPQRAIGWDVAVGADGPVVLEGNARWCEKLVQLPAGRGLTRGAFIRLLHEMGAGGLLARRRMVSAAWRQFEERAIEGEG